MDTQNDGLEKATHLKDGQFGYLSFDSPRVFFLYTPWESKDHKFTGYFWTDHYLSKDLFHPRGDSSVLMVGLTFRVMYTPHIHMHSLTSGDVISPMPRRHEVVPY